MKLSRAHLPYSCIVHICRIRCTKMVRVKCELAGRDPQQFGGWEEDGKSWELRGGAVGTEIVGSQALPNSHLTRPSGNFPNGKGSLASISISFVSGQIMIA